MGKKDGASKLEPINLVQLRRKLTSDEQKEQLKILKNRFDENMDRHKDLKWSDIKAKLEADIDKIRSLHAMEATGGEPDVVGKDEKTGEFLFYDCVDQSPSGRRNICYDRKAQDEREKKGVFPAGNVIDIAEAIGFELLDEAQYRELQEIFEFDTKTQSWVKTPKAIRSHGGGIFCDRRYNHVFMYHNGASSFYSGRGFRGLLRV